MLGHMSMPAYASCPLYVPHPNLCPYASKASKQGPRQPLYHIRELHLTFLEGLEHTPYQKGQMLEAHSQTPKRSRPCPSLFTPQKTETLPQPIHSLTGSACPELLAQVFLSECHSPVQIPGALGLCSVYSSADTPCSTHSPHAAASLSVWACRRPSTAQGLQGFSQVTLMNACHFAATPAWAHDRAQDVPVMSHVVCVQLIGPELYECH